MHRRRWVVVVTVVLALGGLTAPTASAQASSASSNATGWYLAMGDSLAAGYQPGQGDDRTGGYVGGVTNPHRGPVARLSRMSSVANFVPRDSASATYQAS